MSIVSLAVVLAPTWKACVPAPDAEDVLAVEGGAAQHALDFLGQLAEFLVQRLLVLVRVGRVASLHRQFTHALQRVADLAQRAFGGLRQRDAVVGVAHRDVHAAHLRVHAFGDGQAGGVVLGAVDAQAGRQALHRRRQRALRRAEVALGIQRGEVRVDRLRHVACSSGGDGFVGAIRTGRELRTAVALCSHHTHGCIVRSGPLGRSDEMRRFAPQFAARRKRTEPRPGWCPTGVLRVRIAFGAVERAL